ncbi:DUF3325 domain-containing protein [Novilysobacter arseniciresistens]|uniref:DUF3325 domain-containing protein n=1 Tax=Novilysobacter arseniciresistens TaxID=1385522 RepID=UPI000692426D|nr:DUF3325 domain-containing protein [Lysobacter arseniciresistens]
MIAPVILASLLGWALLSLGLPRHHVAVFGSEPGPARSRRLRGTGWVLLALGLPACIGEYGSGQGPVFWASALVVAAIAWVLLMTWLGERRARTASAVRR